VAVVTMLIVQRLLADEEQRADDVAGWRRGLIFSAGWITIKGETGARAEALRREDLTG
jgi:hypothetical protein